MTEKEKIQSLLFAEDIKSVKQGIALLEPLASISQLLEMLDLSHGKIENNQWLEPSDQSFGYISAPHSDYLSLFLLNMLLKHNFEGAWDITSLSVPTDPSDFVHVLKLAKKIETVYLTFSNQDLLELLPSLFPNVQEIYMEQDTSTHFTWKDNSFPKLRILHIIESHSLISADFGNNLRNIEKMVFYAGECSNFSFLKQDMPRITDLSFCESRKFTDVSLLTKFTTLQSLGLDGTSITTIEPLQNLPNLTHLNLIWCHDLKDYTPLMTGFPKLKLIDLTEEILEATSEEAELFAQLKDLQKVQEKRPSIRYAT